jgi:hypothetical protein
MYVYRQGWYSLFWCVVFRVAQRVSVGGCWLWRVGVARWSAVLSCGTVARWGCSLQEQKTKDCYPKTVKI